MTMDVTVEKNISAFKRFSHHHFSGAVFWELFHTWSNPLSIEISTTQRCPIITNNDTIWIEHRNDFEYKIISKVFGYFFVGNKELQYSFNNEGSITLSRMNSRSNDNRSTNSYFFWTRAEVSNDCHFAIITGKCLANYCFPNPILTIGSTQSLK